MKNKFRSRVIWSVVSSILLLYSCKDSFLDVPVTGQLDKNLLSGLKGLDASIIAAYSQVNGRGTRMASPSNWVWGSIRGGEANKGTDPGDYSTINPVQNYNALATGDIISDKWNGNYEGVARANATLKLLKTAAPEVSDKDKLSFEAQAKFLRAHFYFELKRGYNMVPYVDENIDYGTGIEKVKNDQDIWPMIEADMKFAYDNLAETQTDVGRVNKWAAAAYLAKIYLYQGKYTLAQPLFNDVISKGKTSNNKKYGLVAKYPDVFKASNDNSEESIWAYQAAANTGSVNNANPEFDLNWPYNTGSDGPGNCCSFFQPSFELANSFRTSAGLPLLDGSYNTTGQIVTDMGKEASDAFVPDAGPLDPRIDHSIGRRGIPYLDWQDFPGKSWIRNQPNAGPYQTKKFVYYKTDKGSLQDNSSWTPGYTAINFPIIRFADVLLMAAEVEIEVGDPSKARDYVNMVRQRAKNSPLLRADASPAANYSIELYADAWGKDDATRSKVRFERKLELSGEGHRFFDLVRWGIATPVITAYIAYEKGKVGCLGDAAWTSGVDEYLPIPQGQIDLLGPEILKQNTGF